MCARLLLVLSLVLTLTWADQAWSSLLDPITSRDGPADPVTLRRRPQKSVFIVPHLTAPACPTGQRPDSSGRCVQIAQVNQSLQLQFLLQKLSNLYSTAGTAEEDYEYEDSEDEIDDGKPFQVALPLQSFRPPPTSTSAPSTTPSTTAAAALPTQHTNSNSNSNAAPTIISAPTNGKFGNVYSEATDQLETELENLKKVNSEDSTVYNVKFETSQEEPVDSGKYVVTIQPEPEDTSTVDEITEEELETTTYLPETTMTQTTTKRTAPAHEPPFWWVPQGWEAERTRERPLLLRFWSRMPLVRDPGVLPETVPESVVRTRTSGQRGTGRYPSEQYYREVSAHDLYNVLGAKHWRRFRATDR